MRRSLLIALCFLAATGCVSPRPAPRANPPAVLYAFRPEPPALLELSGSYGVLHEIPVAIPPGCGVDGIFPPPEGAKLVIEYGCSFGQAVVWIDTDTGAAEQPVTDSDSHFLAWAPGGMAVYLRVDTMNRPRIIKALLNGGRQEVPITDLTYDVSPKPSNPEAFLFSFSRGMGLGSEMWFTADGGRVVSQVRAEPESYASFARWSPDERQVAFIKVPDSATPFAMGELWVMQADGTNGRRIADADAGHGYGPAWSPSGELLAFVVRTNPQDAQANTDASALRSKIGIARATGSADVRTVGPENTRAQAPVWSPDGTLLFFCAGVDDKMSLYRADIRSGQVEQILTVPACYPMWMHK